VIDPRPHLRALAEATAPGGSLLVPREWVLAIVGESGPPGPVEVDLTIPEVAALFKRAPSTIRGWCDEQILPGAYRNRGREWRIPAAAVRAFQERERHRDPNAPSPRPVSARPSARLSSLSDWRHVS
jgi:hypothetical protein